MSVETTQGTSTLHSLPLGAVFEETSSIPQASIFFSEGAKFRQVGTEKVFLLSVRFYTQLELCF